MKRFNTTGLCLPDRHYMVDISDKIAEIVEMVEQGEYFAINRARQFGKTTTLRMLEKHLQTGYLVFSLSFEASDAMFADVERFVQGFLRKISYEMKYMDLDSEILDRWQNNADEVRDFDSLSRHVTELCQCSPRKIVLLIDEVDKSSENQIFLNFLGMLRNQYLERDRRETFQSVILAGVYDIKNLKLKFRSDEEHKYNSPWNVAADFNVDMSLSAQGIAGMLQAYEKDHKTGMDIEAVAGMIYEYTGGYPYLVSYICKQADETVAGTKEWPDKASAWSLSGIQEAVRLLVKGPNALYDDMIKHVEEYPELYSMLNDILFEGQRYSYHEYDKPTKIGRMFGFIVENHGEVTIANRIFEMQLYSYFLVVELRKNNREREALPEYNQFIKNGMLDMDLVMRKFYDYYVDLAEPNDEKFMEKYGRKIFLMYLKPIINGTGNFYVEDQSHGRYRTDVVVDYRGKQYVIEIKIWHGSEYNRRGEAQLKDYLQAYQVEKGYLLSFDFSKEKHAGVKEMVYEGKTILEVVV